MMEHGGNIHRLSRETGIPVNAMIDFSASINPLGVPDSVARVIQESIGSLVHYPEPFADEFARHLAAGYALDPGSVICGNGSTELIYLVARALSPRKVLLTAPTFSEYERACALQPGSSCVRYMLQSNEGFQIDPSRFIDAMRGCDMAFLCNPNNPTGRILKREDVLEIADAAKRSSCYLVIDEAFIDFIPEYSVIDEVSKNDHVIVLRSLTKFYALSGLRVGYGVFPKEIAEEMKNYKEPWSVNTLAQKAGIAAINDSEYGTRTMAFMEKENSFLQNEFDRLGIEWVPSAANYYLFRMKNARETIASLRSKGILVRACSNFVGLDDSYIRIAVKTREDNAVLLKELESLCAASS